MKQRWRWVFLFFCFLLVGGVGRHAFAQRVFQSFEFFDLNFDTQALGQGNAYTAVSKGFPALFYNPANLEANDKFRLATYFQGEFSPSFALEAINSFDKISKAVSAGKSKADQLAEARTALEGLRLKNAHARANVAILSTWKGWGTGISVKALGLDASIGPDATEAYVRAVSDASFMLGKSFSFMDDHLWVGAVARAIYRLSLDESYTLDGLLASSSQINNLVGGSVGEGLLLDPAVGMTYYVPVLEEAFKPRVSAVLDHIGDEFILSNPGLIKNSGGTAKLVKNKMRAHFGVGAELPKWFIFQPSMDLDIRNVGIQNGDLFKHLHVGGALAITFIDDILGGAFRGGFAQGYYSLGVSGYIWWLKLDAAYYAEELGARVGQSPDRRLVLRLTFEIS